MIGLCEHCVRRESLAAVGLDIPCVMCMLHWIIVGVNIVYNVKAPIQLDFPGKPSQLRGSRKAAVPGLFYTLLLCTQASLLITTVCQLLRNLEERSLGKKLPSKPGRAVSLKEHLGWCYLGSAEGLLRPVGHKISNQEGENPRKKFQQSVRWSQLYS